MKPIDVSKQFAQLEALMPSTVAKNSGLREMSEGDFAPVSLKVPPAPNSAPMVPSSSDKDEWIRWFSGKSDNTIRQEVHLFLQTVEMRNNYEYARKTKKNSAELLVLAAIFCAEQRHQTIESGRREALRKVATHPAPPSVPPPIVERCFIERVQGAIPIAPTPVKEVRRKGPPPLTQQQREMSFVSSFQSEKHSMTGAINAIQEASIQEVLDDVALETKHDTDPHIRRVDTLPYSPTSDPIIKVDDDLAVLLHKAGRGSLPASVKERVMLPSPAPNVPTVPHIPTPLLPREYSEMGHPTKAPAVKVKSKERPSTPEVLKAVFPSRPPGTGKYSLVDDEDGGLKAPRRGDRKPRE